MPRALKTFFFVLLTVLFLGVFFLMTRELLRRAEAFPRHAFNRLQSGLSEIPISSSPGDFRISMEGIHVLFRSFKMAGSAGGYFLEASGAEFLYDWKELWAPNPKVLSVRLDGAVLRLERDAEGAWNLPLRILGRGPLQIDFPGLSLELQESSGSPPYRAKIALNSLHLSRPDALSPWQGETAWGRGLSIGEGGSSFTYDPILDSAVFQLNHAGKTLVMSGVFSGLFNPGETLFQGQIETSGLDIQKLFKSGSQMAGALIVKGDVVTRGTHPQRMLENLKAQGAVDVRNGKFIGRSVIRELFLAMSPLPGLQNVSEPLPTGLLKTQLGAAETSFSMLQSSIEISDKRVFFEDLRFGQPDQYQVQGAGSYGLFSQDADFTAQCVILENLAGEVARLYPALAPLANEQARLVFPFRYKGFWPGIMPEPDLNFIQTKAARQAAQTAEGAK